jgi:CSLREA domain-containing protein
MSRPHLAFLTLIGGAMLLTVAAPVAAAPAAGQLGSTSVKYTVSTPAHAQKNRLAAVTLNLPGNVAAVEGRLVVDRSVAALIGVVPVKGTALRPASVKGGFSFVAYRLSAVSGHNALQLVVLPHRTGSLQLRVVLDAAADAAGRRLKVSSSAPSASGTVAVKAAGQKGVPNRFHAAPLPTSLPNLAPRFSAHPVRKLIGRGTKITRMDLDQVRYGWTTTHARNASCSGSPAGDINGDGCVDAVDLQATTAALISQGKLSALRTRSSGRISRSAITPIPGRTFTVTSTSDSSDANRGNGVCADSQGRCTLRAAIQEADWLQGDDTIAFNIPSSGTPVIQLSSGLPLITSLRGTLTIDGYTQSGARVNSADALTNGRPGVEVRGNGSSRNEYGFYLTSGGNMIRGLAISNIHTGIMLDGTNATLNLIAGNWIGFTAGGSNSGGSHGILVNIGANNNRIGTPRLADRNFVGNWSAGVDVYGTGTEYNVFQNNVFCIRPDGGTAQCTTGIDHNFGPKNGLIGGNDPNEKNVFGPTSFQAVELSHGWDRSLPWGTDTKTTYQINNNRVIGNWLGFRADGTPSNSYASGISGGGDNGQAVNIYDGANYNLVKDNYIASPQDGVQVMAPNARYNEIRNNVMGVAPNGQDAVLGRWGVRLRWQASWEIVQGNTIRNAGSGGIGMTQNTVYNVRISQNIVTNTSGPAILATWDSNSQTGSNQWVQPPRIASATTAKVTGTGINGAEVEVYKATRSANGSNSGLPQVYLGTAIVSTNGTWNLPVSGLAAGDAVTALQIRKDQNTSVLGVNVQVASAPVPDPRIAADDFSRTVNNGWGTADVGGPWGVSDTSSGFSVQNGAGTITTARGVARDALLDVGAADVSISGTVRFSLTPNSGNAFAYVEARRGNTDGYRAQIRVGTTGNVFVQIRKTVNGTESAVAAEASTGLNVSSNGTLAFRFAVKGTHLQVRVWDASSGEPSTWLTEADDSAISRAGAVGLRAYLGSAVGNGPMTLTFDNFLALQP